MHCVGLYPTPDEEVQLDFMERMQRRYRHIPVGYSGHESPDNLDVVKIAIAKGARLLERHVGLPTVDAELNAYSLSPEQADAWLAAAEKSRRICGHHGQPTHRIEKRISQTELDSLSSLCGCVCGRHD